jgi:uncharacterized protein (TIGR03435 family)
MLRYSALSWVLVSALCLLPAPRLARAQPAAGAIPPAKNGLNGTAGVMPSFKFDIISFKPCGEVRPGPIKPEYGGDFFACHCQTILELIYYAYDVPQHPFALSGEPDWADHDLYEFVGKVADEDADAFQKLDLASKRMMMRGMLTDVLQLKLHPDLTPHSVYDLVVGKGEMKLTPYKDGEINKLPDGRTMEGKGLVSFTADGTAYYQGESMPQFAEAIAARIGKQVINKTNLTGPYDFKTFMPPAHYSASMDNTDDSPVPRIFDGVKALGLNLVSAKEVTGTLILDHVELPPQN